MTSRFIAGLLHSIETSQPALLVLDQSNRKFPCKRRKSIYRKADTANALRGAMPKYSRSVVTYGGNRI